MDKNGVVSLLPPKLPCHVIRKRFTMAWLACLGLALCFGMRCNFSVALVQMLDETTTGVAEFAWSTENVYVIDTSFFIGYLLAQFFAAILVLKYQSSMIFGVSIIVCAGLNMLMPMGAKLAYQIYALLRFMQGMAAGFTFPACHSLLRWWAPPLERTRLVAVAYCGPFVGILIGTPLSGCLVNAFGWASAFYVYGVSGILWFLLWHKFVHETPSSDPSIGAEEKMYIEKSLEIGCKCRTVSKLPWKQIFSSAPVWAIVVASFCGSLSYYLVVSLNPQLFLDFARVSVTEFGMIPMFHHLLVTTSILIGGALSDCIWRCLSLRRGTVRKMFTSGGFLLEAGFLFWISSTVTRKDSATINEILLPTGLMILCGIFSGIILSGYFANHLDIAPYYAGFLMAVSNSVGILANLLFPTFTQYITASDKSTGWRTVFIVTAIVQLFGAVFYAIFASGELQLWAKPCSRCEIPEDKPCTLDELKQVEMNGDCWREKLTLNRNC